MPNFKWLLALIPLVAHGSVLISSGTAIYSGSRLVASGGVAFGPVCHTQMGGNGSLTSPTVDCTGAGLFVISQAGFSVAALPPVADSQSNSYTSLTQVNSGSFNNLIRYSLSPSTSASMSWSLAMGGTFAQIEIIGFPASAPVFVAQSAGGGAAGFQPGIITPSGSTLFVSGYQSGGVTTLPTVNSGFAITDAVQDVGGVHLTGAAAWKLSSAAENPTWAESGAATPISAMATWTGVP